MKASYITPAITLFHNDGTFDLESQKALYENLIRCHMDGILIQGSIGEFFAMSLERRKELAEFAVRTINHRTKVILGTSNMIFEEIVPYSNFCLELGADAVMIIPPYYFRFDDDALFHFFDRLAGEICGPVYIYNFPERTGYTISPKTVLKLVSEHKNIVGIKDTIPGFDHTRELIGTVKSRFPDFEVYSGFDDNTAHNVISGGDGCVGGLSNIVPEFCAAWVQALRDNDMEKIIEGQRMIDRFMGLYFISSPFIPIVKEGARMRGIISGSACTFPMPKVTENQAARIAEILDISIKQSNLKGLN